MEKLFPIFIRADEQSICYYYKSLGREFKKFYEYFEKNRDLESDANVKCISTTVTASPQADNNKDEQQRLKNVKQTGGGGNHRSIVNYNTNATTTAWHNNNNNNLNNNNNALSIKSLNLPKDDGTLAYRRKSSGSTPLGGSGIMTARQRQKSYGAARAYQLTRKNRTGTDDDITGIGLIGNASKQAHSSCENTPTLESCGAYNSFFNNTFNVITTQATVNTSSTALTRRLAKLLHQSGNSTITKSQRQPQKLQQCVESSTLLTASTLTTSNYYNEDVPRRLSWERRKDSSALQRSASIDSFAEIVWSDCSSRLPLDIRAAITPFNKRPSASSLFSTCSSTSQGAQLNINYVTSAGNELTHGSGGNVNAISSSNSRRESLLSPSATRRNKQTRILNVNVTKH
uniref:Uncharacterized protein n=1 Tax=Glossina brevipalpis TaxID=37001 RepID=A0A1A9X1B8_9MUSC